MKALEFRKKRQDYDECSKFLFIYFGLKNKIVFDYVFFSFLSVFDK